MQAFDDIRVLQGLCDAYKKWGLYINIYVPEGEDLFEVLKAATFLDFDKHGQIIVDEHGWFLFDTQEEMETAYWQCIGDDGPNENNPYNGPVSVYALTCDPTGHTINENT